MYEHVSTWAVFMLQRAYMCSCKLLVVRYSRNWLFAQCAIIFSTLYSGLFNLVRIRFWFIACVLLALHERAIEVLERRRQEVAHYKVLATTRMMVLIAHLNDDFIESYRRSRHLELIMFVYSATECIADHKRQMYRSRRNDLWQFLR